MLKLDPKKLAITLSIAVTLSLAVYFTVNFVSRSVVVENTTVNGDVRITNDSSSH